MLWFERKLVWRHRKCRALGRYRAQGTWPWSLRLVRHIHSSKGHQTGSTHKGSPISAYSFRRRGAGCRTGKGSCTLQTSAPAARSSRAPGVSSLSHSHISTENHHWEHNGFNRHHSPPTALLVRWKYLKKQMANNWADTKVVLRLSSNATFGNKETKMKEICK